jgi:D-inositol-3-phosphate glycosyltransferase
VRFLGPRAHDALAEVYSAADVLLMPSHSESFGLVALEAQACGLPVVAASVGGLRYAVADGRSGFLVEGHAPGAYAARLLEVLREPLLAERLACGARVQARRFSWETTVDGVLAAYREVAPDVVAEEVPA